MERRRWIKEWKQLGQTGWIYLACVTAVGVALRCWWILNIPAKPVSDFKVYHAIATNLFHHLGFSLHGEPVAYQGMGYPAALGYVYRLAGTPDPLVGKWLNVVLSSATLLIFLLILLRFTERKSIILTAYTIMALLPTYIAYTNVLGSEVLLTFLFTLLIWLQVARFDWRIRMPLLGIVAGLAALTKPFFLVYPLVAGITLWLLTKEGKRTLLSFITITVFAAAVIAPWTYRNYEKFGAFIPVSYNGGFVLYINNNNLNDDGGWMPAETVDTYKDTVRDIRREPGETKGQYDYRRGEAVKQEAKRWILHHPLEFIKLGVLRLEATFFAGAWDLRPWAMNQLKSQEKAKQQAVGKPFHGAQFERDMGFFLGISSILVYALSVAGFLYILVFARRVVQNLFQRNERMPGIIAIPVLNGGFFISIYFVFEGQARYCFPILFLFIICLTVLIDALRKNIVAEKA